MPQKKAQIMLALSHALCKMQASTSVHHSVEHGPGSQGVALKVSCSNIAHDAELKNSPPAAIHWREICEVGFPSTRLMTIHDQ
jgi:hypothetical protein